ncbi:hypothetical protein SEA_TWONLO_66 [Gordonia phage Twonlo]|uniref:Uncharacterized protein n=2 Tax=Dexdertvirus TaxID=2948679 RepID=A0A411CSI5_9CAUD|nr:hypothetical protein J1598_gp67 [Gordonia phage Tiamoceli]QDF19650.1 hypothetical protein SEA_ROADKILL_65 [Gordonia Terrae phage RoadKill]QOI66812.1 hypothetical protein SEA_TWONLO_66 [Gordonia phage Twonlo]QWY80262.1 hypothetical protein SEA_EDMUNDFERRY_66 [Gordonia phage EdmundFerry]WNO27370.1 hypothetical protein SEA_KWEKEL_68 [Gordonia phage Kwekel]QAY16811.1 hypothetical protein SEA_TIAMOCELI_67 [Gordonia phage Tiamoceli]
MPEQILDAHVEMRNRHPIAWVARLTANVDDSSPVADVRLVVTRIDLDAQTPEEVERTAKFYEPPTLGDGFQLVDPSTNERVAFLTVAHLKPQIDPRRPVLQLAALGVSAFPQPDWPLVFGSLDRGDPLAGVYASLNTPRNVKLGWIEGALLNGGELTVDDLLGGGS